MAGRAEVRRENASSRRACQTHQLNPRASDILFREPDLQVSGMNEGVRNEEVGTENVDSPGVVSGEFEIMLC